MRAVGAATEVWLDRASVLKLGIPERTLQHHVTSGKVVTRGGRLTREYLLESLPEDARQRYVVARVLDDASEQPSARDRLGRYEAATAEALLREAARRRELLLAFEEVTPKSILVDGMRVDAPEVRAILESWPCTDEDVLAVFPSWSRPVDVRTLRNSLARVKEHGAIGLVRLARKATREDDGRLCRVPEVVQARLRQLVLDELRHATVTDVYRRLAKEFDQAELPSLRTVRRLVAQIPESQRVLVRDGVRGWNAKASPYILRDRTHLDVGEILCGDEHKFDLFVPDPDDGGRLKRPIATAWLDERSRAFAGWCIALEGNSETIVHSLAHALLPKEDARFSMLCGLPRLLYIDNGTDYSSHRIRDVIGGLGVDFSNANPYNAKAKSIERAFRTLCLQFSRTFPTYAGNTPAARPGIHRELVEQHEAYLEGKRATTPFVSLDELRARFATYVLEYNARQHEGLTDENGRQLSPFQQASFRKAQPRVPSVEEIALLSWPCEERTVRNGQIVIWAPFSYRSDALLGHVGETVRVRRNPADLSRALIHSLEGRFIGAAARIERVPLFGGDDRLLKKEIERIKRARRAERAAVKAAVERQLDGRTDVEIAAERASKRTIAAPAPATPIGPTPPEAARAFSPQAARLVREAKALADVRVDEPAPGPVEPLNVVHLDARPVDDLARFEQEYEPRPPTPQPWDPPGLASVKAANLAEWERAFASWRARQAG